MQELLVQQLKKSWLRHDTSLEAWGQEMGCSAKRFSELTAQFARRALSELSRLGTSGENAMACEWDWEAMQRSANIRSPDSLQPHIQKAFILYISNSVPLPKPTFASIQPDPTLSKLHHLAVLTDLRFRGEAFPEARAIRRKLILHVGPTNSGKTHNALLALGRARTGCYAGPLRLLAHEVFTRFNEGTIGDEGKRTCNLVTGEEQRILDPNGTLSSCTVEMFPLNRRLDVGVVDEIQMIGDPQRGMAWTTVLLAAQCSELHLCGEESVVELVQHMAAELGDDCEVKRYQRLSPLSVAKESLLSDLTKIRRGDCFVTFSRTNIFAFKRMVEEKTGLKVAVAYGGLPPEVREEQARMFNTGEYDVLVASDAVGMGLNLKIRRIVFETLHKWDGRAEVPLSMPQIKQIAGRAGRFGVHTSPTSPDSLDAATNTALGEVTTFEARDMTLLRQAIRAPVVQVKHAKLTPMYTLVGSIATLLPPSTKVSTILTLIANLARTSPLYSLGTFDGVFPVLDALHGIAPMSLSEQMMLFAQAPVNSRDKMVVDAIVDFATCFAEGRRVIPQEWATEVGLMDLLGTIEEYQSVESPPSPSILTRLESSHRCLTLYLWLSYRDNDIFCEMEEARLLRREVEKAIQYCLKSTKFERRERPSALRKRLEKEARMNLSEVNLSGREAESRATV